MNNASLTQVIVFLLVFVGIVGLAISPALVAWARGIETGTQGAFTRKPKETK